MRRAFAVHMTKFWYEFELFNVFVFVRSEDLWFRLRHIFAGHILMHMRWNIAELESFYFNLNFGIAFCLQWNWKSLEKFFVIVCLWTFAPLNDIFIIIVRNSFNFSIHSSQLRNSTYLTDHKHIRNESNHHRLCRLIAHNFSHSTELLPTLARSTDDYRWCWVIFSDISSSPLIPQINFPSNSVVYFRRVIRAASKLMIVRWLSLQSSGS